MGDLNTGLGILTHVAMAGSLYPDASIADIKSGPLFC